MARAWRRGAAIRSGGDSTSSTVVANGTGFAANATHTYAVLGPYTATYAVPIATDESRDAS